MVMKINGNEVAVKTAFAEMFAKSLEVRPCSYKPLEHLELNVDVMGAATSVSLPLPCKRLWFETYCREQNFSRKLTTELLSNEFRMIETPAGPRYFFTAKADVYIEGEIVGTGLAGCSASADDASLNDAVQSATGKALSKALSNAGFGIVDYCKLTPDPVTSPHPGPAPQDVGSTEGFPFQLGEESATTANPTSPAPAPAPAPENNAPVPDQQMQMQSLFAQLGGVNDELARAKQVIYPGRSYKYAGKVLGELPDGVLESLLTKESTDPKTVTAKAAAKLILEDRKNHSGKAIK